MPATEQGGKEKKDGKSTGSGVFDALDPNNMMNNAQKVINSAVNVLEEEIAAGILAAKKMERQFLDVDDLRSDPENLMNRIRRDSHEALDIFLDAFASLTKQIGVLNDAVAKTTEKQNTTATPAPAKAAAAAPLQVLEQDAPATAGQKVNYHFSLHEDSITAPVTIALSKTDFNAAEGNKIAAKNIRIDPDSFVLAPNEEKEIAITVTIPGTSRPGHYNALVTVENMPSVRIILSLEVK